MTTYLIINLKTDELQEENIDNLQTAREYAIEFSEVIDMAGIYGIYATNGDLIGMAVAGVWYKRVDIG